MDCKQRGDFIVVFIIDGQVSEACFLFSKQARDSIMLQTKPLVIFTSLNFTAVIFSSHFCQFPRSKLLFNTYFLCKHLVHLINIITTWLFKTFRKMQLFPDFTETFFSFFRLFHFIWR